MIKVIKAGTFGNYDVFTGSGWKNHTSVRWNKKEKVLQFVSGKHLSRSAVQTVTEQIQAEKK